MKKIILVLFFSIFFVSTINAKTIIFKECYYVSESRFDPKIFEKQEFIIDTKLNNAKWVRVYTDLGLAQEIEHVKKFKELKGYSSEKIKVTNLTIEYIDNKYVKLTSQSVGSTSYFKLDLNLEKKTIEKTDIVNSRSWGNAYLAYTCSGSSDSGTGAKDTLKKIIGK